MLASIYALQLSSIINRYYGYNDIPLRLFFTIANTGKQYLLCRWGWCDVKKCNRVWEQIIRDNGRATGNNGYLPYFIQRRELIRLQSVYYAAKAILNYLALYKPRTDFIEALANMGCPKIKTSTVYEYNNCLLAATDWLRSYATRVNMKQKEVERMQNQGSEKDAMTYEKLVAQLVAAIAPASIPNIDRLTLKQYNEYYRVAKEQQQSKRAA